MANALAESNLAVGRAVVADCVNPVAESREACRAVAGRARVRIVEVEVLCSDKIEHRRRVEERRSDLPGLVCSSWQAVLECEHEPWDRPHLVVDTAFRTPGEAIAYADEHIGA